jgi:hypothetical protein
MDDQDQADTEPARHQVPGPLPVTPSGRTERPEGLAFDVEPGAGLTGVPAGDQSPDHPGAAHTEQAVRETGDGVGLAVPGQQAPSEDDEEGPSRDA